MNRGRSAVQQVGIINVAGHFSVAKTLRCQLEQKVNSVLYFWQFIRYFLYALFLER